MVRVWCLVCNGPECTDADLHRGQGNHRWRQDYRLGGRHGERIRRICPATYTKKQAETEEAVEIADYARGLRIPKAKEAVLFSELADRYYNEHCLEENRKPQTHTYYRVGKWKKYIGKRIAKDITDEDLKAIRSKMRATGLTAATVNRMFNDLRAIFYFGMEKKLLDKNPCEFITKLEEEEAVPQFATQQEINKIRRAAQNLDVRKNRELVRQRLLDCMTTLLHTGARPESMRMCRWENGDVDFAHKAIRFTTYKGRRKHSYWHPIDDVMMELLMRRAATTGKKGPVFDMIDIGRLGSRAIEASGINDNRPEQLKFTLYGLKHCYASHLLMSGATLDEVRRLLGHTDTRMVIKHYGHITQEYLAKVQQKVNLTPKLEEEHQHIVE